MRPLLPIVAAVIFSGCASAHTPGGVAHNYYKACYAGQYEKAAEYLSPKIHRDAPCPDDEISRENAGHNANYTIIAKLGSGTLVQDGSEFRLKNDRLLDIHSPQNLLMRLEQALKNGSAAVIHAMLVPKIAQHYDIGTFADYIKKNGDKFNALYAAIAAHPVPWFEIRSDLAICEISGIMIQFQCIAGEWYISQIHDLFN